MSLTFNNIIYKRISRTSGLQTDTTIPYKTSLDSTYLYYRLGLFLLNLLKLLRIFAALDDYDDGGGYYDDDYDDDNECKYYCTKCTKP